MDYNKIRNVISNMRCKKHNKTPQNIVTTLHGSGKADFKMTTCCTDFHKEIEQRIELEMSKQIDDDFKKL